jgi:hypothetical protein
MDYILPSIRMQDFFIFGVGPQQVEMTLELNPRSMLKTGLISMFWGPKTNN